MLPPNQSLNKRLRESPLAYWKSLQTNVYRLFRYQIITIFSALAHGLVAVDIETINHEYASSIVRVCNMVDKSMFTGIVGLLIVDERYNVKNVG